MSASHAELNSIFNRQKVQLLMRVDATNESILGESIAAKFGELTGEFGRMHMGNRHR